MIQKILHANTTLYPLGEAVHSCTSDIPIRPRDRVTGAEGKQSISFDMQ